MRKLLAVCATLFLLAVPAFAQDADGKAALVRGFRTANAELNAAILDRFVTIKASPAVWAIMDSEAFNGQSTLTHWFANLAGAVSSVATNMEWGDVRATDYSSGYNGKSPLVTNMLDSWKGKIAITVDISFDPDPAQLPILISNLDYLLGPLGSAYSFKPRGGMAFVNIKVDPAAASPAIKVSPDGNTYNITLPAYAYVSQSALEEGLKKGL